MYLHYVFALYICIIYLHYLFALSKVRICMFESAAN